MSLSPEEVEARRQALEARRRQRALERRRQVITTAIVVIMALALTATVGYITYRKGVPSASFSWRWPFFQSPVEDELVTILFLGVDSDKDGPARADAIMVIGFRP